MMAQCRYCGEHVKLTDYQLKKHEFGKCKEKT